MAPATAGLIWLAMGGICIFLGTLVPGFMMYFFGIGALITALILLLNPISILTQLLIFLGISLGLIYLLRHRLEEIFPDDDMPEDE